jgi:hypothetical protein
MMTRAITRGLIRFNGFFWIDQRKETREALTM